MSSDSSVSQSDGELEYGIDGYMFEPTRSDHEDDTTGHVSDDSASDEAGVVGEASAGLDWMLDMAWCTCGLCSSATLGGQRECVCCCEVKKIRERATPAENSTGQTVFYIIYIIKFISRAC